MYKFVFFLFGVGLTSSVVKAKCIPITLVNLNDPDCWLQLDQIHRDILETDPFSKNGTIPCFYKCSLEKIGFLSGGDFVKKTMKDYAYSHLESHKSRRQLYKRYKKSAKEVRREKDVCEKARRFSQLNQEDENRDPVLDGQSCKDPPSEE